MKLSLSDRLEHYYATRPTQIISGGEMERVASKVTTYKPSNISRRLRELSEEGKLKATYEKGIVFYQWANQQSPVEFFNSYKCQCIAPKECLTHV